MLASATASQGTCACTPRVRCDLGTIPQGGAAVEAAVKILKKEPFEKQTYVPFKLVTKENIAEYLK